MKKVIAPHDTLIEQTAGRLAAEFYEIGRSQGMTSVHKTARAYARANLEKFIPKAVELLVDILGNPSTPDDQKVVIHDAILARANDPDAKTVTDINNEMMNKLDIKKIIGNSNKLDQLLTPKRPDPINVVPNNSKVLN